MVIQAIDMAIELINIKPINTAISFLMISIFDPRLNQYCYIRKVIQLSLDI